MLRSFVVAVMVLAGGAAPSAAHAAAVMGDVVVDLFPAGASADLTLFESGALTADPAGAASLTLTGTLDTSGTTPAVTSGALALTDGGGADYLSGTLTGIAFLFSETGDDTVTLEIVPTSGSALADFQPLVIAMVVGEFGTTLADALDLGIAFADGHLALSQVPVPAALPLLATGLGALALWRRRRRANR